MHGGERIERKHGLQQLEICLEKLTFVTFLLRDDGSAAETQNLNICRYNAQLFNLSDCQNPSSRAEQRFGARGVANVTTYPEMLRLNGDAGIIDLARQKLKSQRFKSQQIAAITVH